MRLKVFPEDTEIRADHVEERRGRSRYNEGRRKYLVRRRSVPRLFFPVATMDATIRGAETVWVCEGPKKGLALAQLGLPVVAIESAWGWHEKGSRALLPAELAHRIPRGFARRPWARITRTGATTRSTGTSLEQRSRGCCRRFKSDPRNHERRGVSGGKSRLTPFAYPDFTQESGGLGFSARMLRWNGKAMAGARPAVKRLPMQ